MWSLRQKASGEFYLTYDRDRRYTNSLRGRWEPVGQQGLASTSRCVRINEAAGYLTATDDEGNVRVLVLEE